MVDDREEQRRQKAYALWEEEGRPEGRHDAHWHQADDEAGDGAHDSSGADESASLDDGDPADNVESGKPASQTIKAGRPLKGA